MYSEEMLPKDPVMLLSIVNMKLRDQFANLDLLADFYGIDKTQLIKRMSVIGYYYDEVTNQFK